MNFELSTSKFITKKKDKNNYLITFIYRTLNFAIDINFTNPSMKKINFIITPQKKFIPHYFFSNFFDDKIDSYKSKYPHDYLEFIMENGEGIIGEYLRIYPPHIAEKYDIVNRDICKSIIREYGISKDIIKESVLIGDTIDNDFIIFWKHFYYVFSTQGPNGGFFEKTGKSIYDPIKFYNSGKYWDPIDIHLFTPFNSEWILNLTYLNINRFLYSTPN